MPSTGPWVQTQATADIIVAVTITSITTAGTIIVVVTINHGVIERTNSISDLHVLGVSQRHWTPEKMKHTEFS